MNIYHPLDSKFNSKLRFYSVETQRSYAREGEVVFREGIAYIDAIFDLEVFDKLHEPSLLGIERILPNGEKVYVLFNVLNVKPMHYELPALTREVPPVLKWDYLERIKESWSSPGENWMEVSAVHAGYVLSVRDGKLDFRKSNLSPLVGCKAHIMSSDVIKEMVCVPDGTDIGILKGFNVPLTVDIYSMYRYHTGIFGFTGCGKSNLASMLIRKLLGKYPDIKVLVVDVAGEYTVHLVDLLRELNGCVFTPEKLSLDKFVESQVIPETLLERLSEEVVKEELKKVKIRNIDTSLNIEEGGRGLATAQLKRTLAREVVLNPSFPSVNVMYIPDPKTAREILSNLIKEIFRIKKVEQVGNRVLIVVDEAQEFIPDKTRKEDHTEESNVAVETLLRQGRKYHIGGWIITQRLAHLNTNALQQLHSYFVSVLPRTYDRIVVSDAFSISRSMVDKVAELDVGEWLFVSYRATKLRNVPVEIKAYNNEDFIVEYFNATGVPR